MASRYSPQSSFSCGPFLGGLQQSLILIVDRLDFHANAIRALHLHFSTHTVATLARPADHQLRLVDMDTEAIPAQQAAIPTAAAQMRRLGAPLRIRSMSKYSSPNTHQPTNLTSTCRGHYSDAVLSSLESQNDSEVEGITAKVKMLKDVSHSPAVDCNMKAKVFQSATPNENCQLSIAIGDEIRDTTYLEGLESSFENTRVRIRGNMTRMMRVADSTGVSWKVWLGFFFAVFLLFFYVWIF